MTPARMARGVLVWIAFSAGAAFARSPQEFQAPHEMTQEELAASKAKSKYGINPYGKDAPVQAKPFPWAATALFALAFAVALPFAVRHYAKVSKEIKDNQAFGGRNSRSQSSEE